MNHLEIKLACINKTSANINELLDKNNIINKDPFNEICKLKTQIDTIDYDRWKIIRSVVTDYEFIGNNNIHNINKIKKIKYISRAYFKLIEILNRTNILDGKTKIKACCLAEAPGGFIQCLKEFSDFESIVGISLNDNSINFSDKAFKDDKRISYMYGDPKKNHDGNLYNPDIITYFCKRNRDVDLVTADGGFEVDNENFKGQYHNQLFLAETYIALRTLKHGGSFIIKIYELSNNTIMDLYLILYYLFDNIKIIKPVISREMNNEKYIVCTGLNKNRKKYRAFTDKIYGILGKLWKDKDLIPVKLLKDVNYGAFKSISYLFDIDSYLLNVQRCKIAEALKLHNTHRSKRDLYSVLDYHRSDKYVKALKWLKKNNLLLYKNG